MSDFDESKVQRDDAGKFSSMGGEGKQSLAKAIAGKQRGQQQKALEKLVKSRVDVSPDARATAVSILRDAGSLTDALEAAEGHTEDTIMHPDTGKDVPMKEVRAALNAMKPPPIPEGEEMVTVHHATDEKSAKLFLKEGIIPELKGDTLASARHAAGEDATFAPGAGLSRGMYVAKEGAAESYGRVVLALRVPKSYLQASPEQTTLGVKDAMESLGTHDGAVITKGIPPSAITRL